MSAFFDRLNRLASERREWLREQVAAFFEEQDAVRVRGYDESTGEYDESAHRKRPIPPPSPVVILSPAAKATGLAAYFDALCSECGEPLERFIMFEAFRPYEVSEEWDDAHRRWTVYKLYCLTVKENADTRHEWEPTLAHWLDEIEQQDAGSGAIPEAGDAPPACVFGDLNKKQFYISGFGESGTVKKLRGLEHIKMLILAGGKPVSPEELTAGVFRGDAGSESAEGLSMAISTKQGQADQQAKKDMEARLAEIEVEAPQAARDRDILVLEELKDEKDRLQAQLKSDWKPSGQSRDMYSDGDSMANTITANLRNARKELKNSYHMPQLAEHFKASVVRKNNKFAYAPAGLAPDWRCQ